MGIPDEERQQSLDKENVEAAASQPDGNKTEMGLAMGEVEQQVKDFMESTKYKNYTRAMHKLPSLSEEERALVLQQNPHATYMAPAEVWEKGFKRRVQPQAKGVELPRPVMREVQKQRPHKTAAGKTVLNVYGKPLMETFWEKVPISPTTTFYDVFQTEGAPFPDIMHASLPERVKNFLGLKRAIEQAFPDVLRPQEYLGAETLNIDARYIDWKPISKSRIIRSLLHKAAHAVLHKENASHLDTHTKEIEADSLAFEVGKYYGLDLARGCLPYIATLSSSQDLPELHAFLPRMQQASEKLTTAIDAELVKIQKKEKITVEQRRAARRASHLKRPEDRKPVRDLSEGSNQSEGEHRMNMAVWDLRNDAASFAQLEVCSDYRAAMKKMPSYSAEVYDLVFQQDPYALHVAPAEVWEKEFGRRVLPGERGIEIPASALHEAEQKGASGQPSLGADEKPTGKRPVKEKTALVYDIFQTKGKDFPEIVPRQFALTPYINNLPAANVSMIEQAIQQAFPNSALSFKNLTTKQEVADRTYIVLPKMKERMVIRALLHEAAHDVLHTGKAQNLDTHTKEVQADSLAFVVGQYYNIDLSECVFPYIGVCSSSPEAPELQHFWPQIQENASKMVAAIDTELAKIQARPKQQKQKKQQNNEEKSFVEEETYHEFRDKALDVKPGKKEIESVLEWTEKAVQAYMGTRTYAKYRSAMRKLPILNTRDYARIFKQIPDARYMATQDIWEIQFNRRPFRKAQGVPVTTYKRCNVEVPCKTEKGEPILKADGTPQTEIVTRIVPNATRVLVYDVSQTAGWEFPDVIKKDKRTGKVEDFAILRKAISQAFPSAAVPKEYPTDISLKERQYILRPDMSQTLTIRALVHEAAYAVLDTTDVHASDMRTREVEAESLAFVVCKHYHLDVANICLPYIAICSSNGAPELHNSIPRIQEAAKKLIAAVDKKRSRFRTDEKYIPSEEKPIKESDAQMTPKTEKRMGIQEQLAAARSEAEQKRGSGAVKPSPGKDPER